MEEGHVVISEIHVLALQDKLGCIYQPSAQLSNAIPPIDQIVTVLYCTCRHNVHSTSYGR